MARVIFVNNDGGGFVERPEISETETISSFFMTKMGQGANANRYTIKVQRKQGDSYVPVEDVTPDYRLQEGDRISFSPAKQVGA